MNLESSEVAHFKQYGKTFQEKIFQSLINDKTWSIQMIEVMTSDYFELKYLQFLVYSDFSILRKENRCLTFFPRKYLFKYLKFNFPLS